MKGHDQELRDRVAALRLGFDQGFAAPEQGLKEEREDLLGVVAGERHALRVGEISGLLPCGHIVPLPSPVQELLGITGLRGGLVPVYSLAALLGYRAPPGPPRWLVLCGGDDPLALAVSELVGFWQVPRAALCPAGALAREHVTAIAPGAPPCAILSVPSVMKEIRRRAGAPAQER